MRAKHFNESLLPDEQMDSTVAVDIELIQINLHHSKAVSATLPFQLYNGPHVGFPKSIQFLPARVREWY